jgi:hypothetical protein
VVRIVFRRPILERSEEKHKVVVIKVGTKCISGFENQKHYRNFKLKVVHSTETANKSYKHTFKCGERLESEICEKSRTRFELSFYLENSLIRTFILRFSTRFVFLRLLVHRVMSSIQVRRDLN